MDNVSLLASTGNKQVEKILRGIVGIYETVFPGRIRGYYLLGSYTDATDVSISDIDMAILFKGPSVEDKEGAINHSCSLISPIRLDITSLSEERLPPEDVRLKLGSTLLYGQDIRDSIELPSIDAYQRYITRWPLHFLKRIHNTEHLTFPLDYPEPEGLFYGYDRIKIPQWYPASASNGTKELVASICWMATAIVALRAERYIGKKADGIRAYKECVGDEWAIFAENIYEQCKLQWKYQVPLDKEDQQTLHDMCRQTLGFENHYLAIYREYLLAHLQSNSRERQLFAIERLDEVIYPDEEIIVAKVVSGEYAHVAAYLSSRDNV